MTPDVRRIAIALTMLIALFVLALPAGGTEEPADGGSTGSETAVEAPAPAITLPEDAPEEEVPEWSYRFLVPATMVLGFLAVIATIFMYFIRVTKNRYRVVE